MNSCSMGEPETHPLTRCDLQCSFHQPRGSPLEPQNTEEKSAKVKRRRTRRERNSTRFGRNATDRISEQRSACRGQQKMLPPFWSSQLSQCAKSMPFQAIKGTCVAKPVIITQNRLSQHFGMFNREVKSADIERLLSPRAEQLINEITPIQSDIGTEVVIVRENKSCKSCDVNHKCIPNEEFACTGKDLNGTKEDFTPTVVDIVPISTEEHCDVASVQDVNAGSQPSAASATVDFSQQTTENETFQSNAPVALNEKENVPPVPTTQVEPGKEKFLVKKLAQELQKLLDLKAIFPGRNLISETRQAVIRLLQEQKKTLPDVSTLAQLKKLATGCNRDAIHADFRSRDQEELQYKLKTSDCSRRSSDQVVSSKKRRGLDQTFFTSPFPSSLHTVLRMASTSMAEERLAERESVEFFVEPEEVDQHSFYLTAVQPHPHLLSASSEHMTSTRTFFASDEHCSLSEALLRTAHPSERLERSEVAKRVFSKESNSKRHCIPFTAHDSLDSTNLSMNGHGSDPFPFTDLQQYSYNYEQSPDQWNLREAETAAILNPSQELHSSLPLDMGLGPTERALSESQTSFDVLKSIWSPHVPSRGARRPASRVLSYSCLAQQPLSARELNSGQRQTEDFLQLFSVIPQQHSFCGQNPQQDICVPSRHQQDGNRFSVLANSRPCYHKVSGKQRRPSNGQQVWGLMEVPERMQGNREGGSFRSGNHDLERLLQLERAQQLQAFQQLPMSHFPPSEALEEDPDSSLCSFQGHLLGQASPEPWAFPRMKLY
nr:uncharacterized protein LOC110086758 isoform X1 [Pogona vitticeps]XP_020663574.1 uncharacterized protein LOC110086758 isoform X1 [Pogona vitticeps]